MGKRAEKVVHFTATEKAQLDELLKDRRYLELAERLLAVLPRIAVDRLDPNTVGGRFYKLKRQGGYIKQTEAQVMEEFHVSRSTVRELVKEYEELLDKKGLPDYYR